MANYVFFTTAAFLVFRGIWISERSYFFGNPRVYGCAVGLEAVSVSKMLFSNFLYIEIKHKFD